MNLSQNLRLMQMIDKQSSGKISQHQINFAITGNYLAESAL